MTALSETPFRKEEIGHLFERGNRILAALSFADESDSLFLNRKGLFEGRAGIEHRPRLRVRLSSYSTTGTESWRGRRHPVNVADRRIVDKINSCIKRISRL
ncbi:MAG: hypothetical protein U0N52_02150 [Muribaculaceae bacterium]